MISPSLFSDLSLNVSTLMVVSFMECFLLIGQTALLDEHSMIRSCHPIPIIWMEKLEDDPTRKLAFSHLHSGDVKPVPHRPSRTNYL